MAIKIIVDVHVRVELFDDYITHLKHKIVETREFEGCLGAELYADQDLPGRMAVVEEWRSREDQQRYVDWRRSQGGMADVYSQPLKFSFYDHVES